MIENEKMILENFIKNAKLKNGEVVDDLLDGKHFIIQNRNLYCFTSDSVLLANFVCPNKKDIIVDLCSGSGIIGILLNIRHNTQKTILVELQKELSEMASRSIELDGLNNIEIINSKIQGINKIIGSEKVDIVVVNPPYEKKDSGFTSANESIKLARSEELINLKDIVLEANLLLKYGGELDICIPVKRMFELSSLMSEFNFGIKQVKLMMNKNNTARLALLKATKGGKDYTNISIEF